jgi:hypothetical protein
MDDPAAPTPRTGELAPSRKKWAPPLLIAHPSLTALTQAQFSQGMAIDSTNGGPQPAVPCSQGFCP